ncbi:MipA/OmpV family protein [Leclercia adecarboxylata]|uniref:MipA/OmpV family protein n=1 Tax=Leclercia adecarboxylata TaxID=83655 RepID=UPI002DBB6B4E|nr:MipA/OmpV family protein [Leclercia adecarboxylata]MEB6380993.1 MipA/OmpV family protein [Leclercia adecarboxylata]
MKFKKSLLIATVLFAAAPVMAEGFSIGAGAVFNESPYKGYNENVSAVPLISYEGEHFYVRQATGGWIVWKDAKNELSLTTSWMPLHFDPEDNDDPAMKQLDERKASAMLGGAYYHHESWGSLKLAIAADAMDESGGMMGEMSWFRPFRIERLTLTPSLGVFFHDDSFNDYYYGVSEKESRRSDLQQYTAGETVTPYVGVAAKYPLTQNLYLNASAVYTVLPDEVKNSPMIDRDDSVALMTGLTWTF